jgi:AraC-like DNA-binding protein
LQSRALPEIEVGLVEGRRSRNLRPARNWYGPFSWDTWVVDWVPWDRTQIQTSTDGRTFTQPHARPQWSWYLFAPHCAYKHFELDGHEYVDSLWFFFKGKHKFPPLTNRPFSVFVDPEERLCDHVRTMYGLQQSGEPGAKLTIHAYALAFLTELLGASQQGGLGTPAEPWRIRNPLDRGASDLTLLNRVDSEVMRRIKAPPSMDELAEALNMSVSSLAHRFKEETGSTLMERVRWLRIREARALLAHPGASVKGVARKLAFSSPFHLSKLFHEMTGVTAQDYIRRHQR